MGSVQEWTPSKVQLKFLKKLGLNTHKGSSTSTKELNFGKIFVIASCCTETRRPENFLCRTDLSSERKGNDNATRPLQPVLRFRCSYGSFAYLAYAIVGSSLFMIGGMDCEYNRWMRESCWYDLRDAMRSGTTTTLVVTDLKMGPSMKGRKFYPIAAVVRGYLICVFSRILYDKNQIKVYDENQVHRGSPYWGTPNFEVFDTTKWSWTELSELIDNYKEFGLDEIYIRSYCIEGSCLIVCSDIGIYGIDVDAEKLKWVKLEGSERIERSPFRGRWAMVGLNVCSPFEVGKWEEAQAFGFNSGGGLGTLCSHRDENGVILCRVTGNFTSRTRFPVLSVNVAKFDGGLLEKLSGGIWKSIPSDKSCTFEIEYESCITMELDGCWFQLKEMEEFEPEKVKAERRSKMVGTAAVVGSLISMLYYFVW